MATTAVKALLFLAGGSAAAAGTAYVSGALDPYIGTTPPTVAALPDTPATASKLPAEVAPLEPAAIPQMSLGEPEPAAETAISVPDFSLLRVESDGSAVIAGNAPPNTKVDVLAGTTVIGSAEASGEGDFAVVLDQPLKPGDYHLVLRSTGPDDAVVTSTETAIVSVPTETSGEVLAMVEQGGRPVVADGTVEMSDSAVAMPAVPDLTTEPIGTGHAGEEPGVADAPAPAEDQPGSKEAALEPAATEPPVASETAAEGTVVVAPATEADEPVGEQQQAALQPALAGRLDAPAASAGQAPAADGVRVGEGAILAPEPEVGPEKAPRAMSGPEVEDQRHEEHQQAALAPQPSPAETKTEPPMAAGQPPIVLVEAVEIEGRMVFVAGVADPGRRVRGYANAILLGDAVASPDGRFLIETQRELPVGEYIIRIDALDSDGSKVVARAAVAFDREPGERMAAVAQLDPEPPATHTGSGRADPAVPAEAAAAQAVAPEVTQAPASAAAAPVPALPDPAGQSAPTAEASSAGRPTVELPVAAAPAPSANESRSVTDARAAGPATPAGETSEIVQAPAAPPTSPPRAEAPAAGSEAPEVAEAAAVRRPEATVDAPAGGTTASQARAQRPEPASEQEVAEAAAAESPLAAAAPAISTTPRAENPSRALADAQAPGGRAMADPAAAETPKADASSLADAAAQAGTRNTGIPVEAPPVVRVPPLPDAPAAAEPHGSGTASATADPFPAATPKAGDSAVVESAASAPARATETDTATGAPAQPEKTPSIVEAPAVVTMNSPDNAEKAPAARPAADAALAAPPSVPGSGVPTVDDVAVPAKPAATAEVPAARTPLPAEAPAQAPAGAERTAAAGPPPVDVPEVTAPKLQNVKSAVIIRRGDTLWRISRRVYGRGIRYSTIYQANRQQIQDPDWIWPGQVFRVPEKSKEGDAADMSKIAEQSITVPEELDLPVGQ